MSRILRNAVRAIALASVFALCACVTVFPRDKPVTLYRLALPAESTAPSPHSVNVLLSHGSFASAAADDRIIAVSNDRVFYVAGARWTEPAESLFYTTAVRIFDAHRGPTRLVRRGTPAPTAYMLDLSVERFETEYGADATAAPTVVVAFHALLVRSSDHMIVGDQSFEARSSTQGNRISAFIPAYDQALADSVGRLAAWVDERVSAQASAD